MTGRLAEDRKLNQTLSIPCPNLFSKQRCGTLTILYGSGSGSDFWKVMVPVPTFEKLWFRFRFLLLKSYGSGSGSGSSSISRPYKANFSNKFLAKNLTVFTT
jgi:hypothetical protein